MNAGFLAEEDKAVAKSRHHLILKVLKHETSTAEGILGPPLGRGGTRCPKEEKALFHVALEEWRDNYWESICGENLMLSRAWVLGEGSIKRLVDQLRLIINTEKEKIDKKWIQALIDTTASDKAIDDLSAMIQHFHGGFFAHHKQQKRPKPSKQQKRGEVRSSIGRRIP